MANPGNKEVIDATISATTDVISDIFRAKSAVERVEDVSHFMHGVELGILTGRHAYDNPADELEQLLRAYDVDTLDEYDGSLDRLRGAVLGALVVPYLMGQIESTIVAQEAAIEPGAQDV